MQAAPGLDRLVEDELGVLVATERQRHDEDPRAAHAATLGIEELAGVAEVHLRFLTRRDFEAQRGAASRRREPAQEAFHRGVAAGKAVLLDEELPDRLPFHATLVQGEHALAPRLHERLFMRRALARRRRQQLRERGRGGQRAAVEHAVTSRPHAIPGDGVATDAEVPGDPTIRLAQLQPPENLADVGHWTPPSRHSSPPGVGVLQRGFLVTARTRKESGHAPPGGSLWPTLGGSGWVTLPGSRWATPGGSASPTPVDHYGVAADKVRLDALADLVRLRSAVLLAAARPQPGSAPALGAGGRRFKSSHPDQRIEGSGQRMTKLVGVMLMAVVVALTGAAWAFNCPVVIKQAEDMLKKAEAKPNADTKPLIDESKKYLAEARAHHENAKTKRDHGDAVRKAKFALALAEEAVTLQTP